MPNARLTSRPVSRHMWREMAIEIQRLHPEVRAITGSYTDPHRGVDKCAGIVGDPSSVVTLCVLVGEWHQLRWPVDGLTLAEYAAHYASGMYLAEGGPLPLVVLPKIKVEDWNPNALPT